MRKEASSVYVGLPGWSGDRTLNIDTGRMRFEYQFSTAELEQMVSEGWRALDGNARKKLLKEFQKPSEDDSSTNKPETPPPPPSNPADSLAYGTFPPPDDKPGSADRSTSSGKGGKGGK